MIKTLNQNGQMFILAVIVLLVILLNSIVLVSKSLTFSQNSKYSLESIEATHLAEAGIDKATAALNASAGSYTGETETFLGNGSYAVSITPKNASTNIITSTGYIPNKTNPKIKRTIKIETSKGVGLAFNYGVQVGEGGLVMGNNSIIDGSVYSNGNIVMTNNSSITGDAYVAGGVAPLPDQTSDCTPPNCTDYIFGKVVNGENRMDVAQSFQPSVNYVLNKVTLKLKKNGTPPDLSVKIVTDGGNKPSKTVITQGTLYASLVSTSQYGFIDVAMNPIRDMTIDTPYWIIVDTCANNTNCNSSDYWYWAADTLSSYNRGSATWAPNWQAGSVNWSNFSYDLGFQTYMGGLATSIKGAPNAVIGKIVGGQRIGDAHASILEDITITKDAYFQSLNGTVNIGGTSYPGSPTPPTQVMPISTANIDTWKTLATNVGTTTGNITTCPATMAGKYIGNVTLPLGCTVTVNDYVYVTGTLYMNGDDTLKINSTKGAASFSFIIDGQVTLRNNNKILGSGTSGSYLILVSEYNTRDDPLNKYAIIVDNNGNTGILYSNLGAIYIANNNTMTEITGWKLVLENNVTINYDQGLAGAIFSSGPTGAFSAIKGTYQIN